MSKVIFIKWIIQLTFDKACKTLIYFENQRNSTCISFDYQQFLMVFFLYSGRMESNHDKSCLQFFARSFRSVIKDGIKVLSCHGREL